MTPALLSVPGLNWEGVRLEINLKTLNPFESDLRAAPDLAQILDLTPATLSLEPETAALSNSANRGKVPTFPDESGKPLRFDLAELQELLIRSAKRLDSEFGDG